MRGRLVSLVIGLAVMLIPALWNFDGTSAQNAPLPFPTHATTATPAPDIFRGVQPTADPSLVPLPRLSDSLPNATATPAYEGEPDAPRTTLQTAGDAIRSVNFGDENELIAALSDPATREIYLIPDGGNTAFMLNKHTQRLDFRYDVILYGNNATFEPSTLDWEFSMFIIRPFITVKIHQITVRNARHVVTLSGDNYSGAIINYGRLIIDDSFFINGYARDGGGAIFNTNNLTIGLTIFENNQAGGGGAIQNDFDGNLTISCSRFSGNSALYGGAILQGNTNISSSSQINISSSSLNDNGEEDIYSYTSNVNIQATSNWWGADGPNVFSPDSSINTSNVLANDPTIAPSYGANCQPRTSIKFPPTAAINLFDHGIEAPNAAQAEDLLVSDSIYKQTLENQTGILTLETRIKDWTIEEIAALSQGVSNIASAFNLIRPSFTAQDSFRKGMGIDSRGNVRFIRISGFGICQNVLSVIPRTIVCGDIDGFDKYVVVHELGHTFDNQSDQNGAVSITEKINTTRDNNGFISDNRGWVMGNYPQGRCGENGTSFYPNGWSRGERGWGSGPSSVYSLSSVDERCQTSSQPNFTDFQKNPPPYTPESSRTLPEIENQETGADMFLNWIYRTLGQGGFVNRSWKPSDLNPDNLQQYCNQTFEGCAGDMGSNSGDSRMGWFNLFMTDALNRLFSS